ncbi:MAG: ABC transporter permease subunit [Planctomycetaceae bacterium]|nr:ABC transporter permease subunit [Planctomycetaceae bacterium]
MNFAEMMTSIGVLAKDTFLQARAQGIFWVLLGITAVCVALCLSAGVNGTATLAAPGENPDFLPRHDAEAQDPKRLEQSGVSVVSGELTLAFGAIRVPLARDARTAVHTLQFALANGVADTLGVLFALVWTAGFLPRFLDPRAISVLLAKPTPRWCLLVGKYLGVLAFVLVQASLFVVGTWLALGVRTGIWDTPYLLSIPCLLLHFAIFFGFSALLAVCFRSTVVCVFGSIAFWALCWMANYGRHSIVAEVYKDSDSVFAGGLTTLLEAAYWILPKPADLGIMLSNALDAGQHFAQPVAYSSVQAHGAFHPWLSVLASALFAVVVLFAASRQFEATDY